VQRPSWDTIAALFEAIASLAPDERRARLDVIRRSDPRMAAELDSLLAASEGASERFLADGAPPAPPRLHGTLEAGLRVGLWRIERPLGAGGMGEVYAVTRADGQFDQRAALKVTQEASAELLERFHAERRILARLEHPGIARILDGGTLADGRPYAVVEYVDGEPITEHCDARGLGARSRVELFVEVCEAVAYAHRHLVVHRDLKPANVLVDRDGRPRLLDFGIAKDLGTGWTRGIDGTAATRALATPDYAAPEQLAGEPITTAADVFALGVLAYELLTGRRPWTVAALPLAHAVRALLESAAAAPSTVASATARRPIDAHALRGDLDAIVLKCLRREPELRYASVEDLMRDVRRHLAGEPVKARRATVGYRASHFVRRYRWLVGATCALIVVLAGGIAATAWQANRAREEATRAAAIQQFLVDVFRASDPRVASDTPRGQITAKQLLDLSVDRIGTEFAADVHTQLELLGVVRDIYGHWGDQERFLALLHERADLARRTYGPYHPAVIESLTTDAWASIYDQDFSAAARRLDEADRLIRRGGHDDTTLRAQWWLARAESLRASSDYARRLEALDAAIGLYERLAPRSPDLAIALANSAIVAHRREDYAGARERNERALRLFEAASEPADAERAMTYANLARSLQELGRFDEAEQAYGRFAELARRTYGERHGSYWRGAADHARLAHLRGDRERAWRMYAALEAAIPADWQRTTEDAAVDESIGTSQLAEGRIAEAIPRLERVERTYAERPGRDHDLRRVRAILGDAYDRAGRTAEARTRLAAARDEYLQREAAHSAAVLAVRERWARFLLERGDLAGAAAELAEVISRAGTRTVAPAVRAYATRARLRLVGGDLEGAAADSGEAVRRLEKVEGLYDVRLRAEVWDVHAGVAERRGERSAADRYAERARADRLRYGAPPPVVRLVDNSR
jgi:serine/threonine-protein kinase